MKPMTRIQYRIWRWQRWKPLPDIYGPSAGAMVIHHSRWRAALRACRCIGCVLDRLEDKRDMSTREQGE